MRLSHRAVPRETVVGVDPRRESRTEGKQVPPEWTETSRGLLEWWHDAGVALTFLVESASSCDATGTPRILSRTSSERIPHLELGGGNGAPLDMCWTLVLLLEW